MSCKTGHKCVTFNKCANVLVLERKENAMKMMKADDIVDALEVSKATAYKIIRQLNEELTAAGYRTLRGRVNRDYFEKVYFSVPKSSRNNTLRGKGEYGDGRK